MKILEIVPAQRWISDDGRTASVTGALPYHSETQRIVEGWHIESVGYTWRRDDGRIGLARAPAPTQKEALEVMERINARAH